MMSFGGNNRAQVFFKQHGWTDGGKIEAKYTSRAADLYRQLLSKEVAKSAADDLPSSPAASQPKSNDNGHFDIDSSVVIPSQEKLEVKSKVPEVANHSSKPSTTITASNVRKPIVARKTGSKTVGLGARKLTAKVLELHSCLL